jgi:hypothetical protein
MVASLGLKDKSAGKSDLPQMIPPALFLALATSPKLKDEKYNLRQLMIGFRKWEQENGKGILDRGHKTDAKTLMTVAQDYVRKNSSKYKTKEQRKPETLSHDQQEAIKTLEDHGVDLGDLGLEFEPDQNDQGAPDVVSTLSPAMLAAELIAIAQSANPGTAAALALAANKLSDVSITGTKMLIGKIENRAKTDQEKGVCLYGIHALEAEKLEQEDVAALRSLAKKEAEAKGGPDEIAAGLLAIAEQKDPEPIKQATLTPPDGQPIKPHALNPFFINPEPKKLWEA